MTETPYDFIDTNKVRELTDKEATFGEFRELFGIEADDPYKTRLTKDEVKKAAEELDIPIRDNWSKARIIFELVHHTRYPDNSSSLKDWRNARRSARNFSYIQKREVKTLIGEKVDQTPSGTETDEAAGTNTEESNTEGSTSKGSPSKGEEDEKHFIDGSTEPSRKQYPEGQSFRGWFAEGVKDLIDSLRKD